MKRMQNNDMFFVCLFVSFCFVLVFVFVLFCFFPPYRAVEKGNQGAGQNCVIKINVTTGSTSHIHTLFDTISILWLNFSTLVTG